MMWNGCKLNTPRSPSASPFPKAIPHWTGRKGLTKAVFRYEHWDLMIWCAPREIFGVRYATITSFHQRMTAYQLWCKKTWVRTPAFSSRHIDVIMRGKAIQYSQTSICDTATLENMVPGGFTGHQQWLPTPQPLNQATFAVHRIKQSVFWKAWMRGYSWILKEVRLTTNTVNTYGHCLLPGKWIGTHILS